jgi:two-component system sensor histidine kinase FlrB
MPPTHHSDLLIGLASQKCQEANETSKRLQELANFLRIGLVELDDGAIAQINDRALEFLPLEMRGVSALRNVIASLPQQGSRSLEFTGSVVQFTRLKVSDTRELLLVQDVTETFFTARKLKERERLTILGQMSAQMAHQVKTPLAVLAGQAQILARRLDSDPVLKDQALEIYVEARDLAQKVNEIVQFYREREINVGSVHLRTLLYDIRTRLGSPENTCEICVQCPDGLEIETDAGLMQNILFLLGQNAIAPGVSATLISLDARVEDGEVVITVSDNGSGIPEEIRPRMFEPFVGTGGEGMGLGLFLAKDLTQQLGGTIEWQDRAQGTCFVMRFALRGH